MFTRLNSVVRGIGITALALAIAAPSASAQTAKVDGRWHAWLGCWTPANTLIRVLGNSAASVVCVVPSSTPSAVDVMTVTGGKIVDRNHVDTDGRPHAISKEGCTGSQTATWSPSSRRVYMKSDFTCNGGPTTHLNAMYAMAGSDEWIDVQGLKVEKKSGVHALRYREAVYDGTLPDEIKQKLQDQPFARSAAMLAATQPISLSDVEEASHAVDAAVVSTWLIETDKVSAEKPDRLNAKQLVQLADNGVPGSVIDVMVGLSYPDVFAINPMNSEVALQNSDSVAYAGSGYRGRYASSALNPIIGFDRLGNPIYESESSLMYGCTPFLYGPYDMGWNPSCARYGYGYSSYGYGGGLGLYDGYGWPFYGGYPGYGGYYGGGPVVVPVNPGTPGGTTHGRVINGKGYRQGGGESGTTAAPRSNTQSGSGSGSGGGGASSGSSSPPPPPPRTAVPRKP